MQKPHFIYKLLNIDQIQFKELIKDHKVQILDYRQTIAGTLDRI